ELDYQITGNKESFSQTLQGIQLATESGMIVNANMVLTRLNLNDLYDNAKLLAKNGIKKFTVNKAIPPSNCGDFSEYTLSREDFNKVPLIIKRIKDELGIMVGSVEAYPLCMIEDIELLKEIGFDRVCLAGQTFCVISPLGKLRGCIAMENSVDGHLETAWAALKPKTLIPKECSGCTLLPVCKGGCEAVRRIQCEDFKSVDPYATHENKQLNAKLIHPSNKTDIQSLKAENYRFLVKVRFREEVFGGVLFRGNRSFEFLDKRGYAFCLEYFHQIFTFDNIMQYCECTTDEAYLFLTRLLSKKLIYVVE
ncbi:MAG: SPASM domain-containing protein, partial [Erysipelotrichaceae bacterium]